MFAYKYAQVQGCLSPDRGGKRWTSFYWKSWFFKVLSTCCFSQFHGPSGRCSLLPNNHPYRTPNYPDISSMLCTESSWSSRPTRSPGDNLSTTSLSGSGSDFFLKDRHFGTARCSRRAHHKVTCVKQVHIPVAAHPHLLIRKAICSSLNVFLALIRDSGTSGDWRAKRWMSTSGLCLPT